MNGSRSASNLLCAIWRSRALLEHHVYHFWDHYLNMFHQSEGLTERINEPPWGRCLQGAVDVRWVVVVVVSSSPRTASSRALGSTVTLLRSNGDASMGLDDGAIKTVSHSLIGAELVCITWAEPRGVILDLPDRKNSIQSPTGPLPDRKNSIQSPTGPLPDDKYEILAKVSQIFIYLPP